jgi:hypothetical protein
VSIRIRSFQRGAERNIQSVVDVLSDRPLDEYSSSDAAAYRDYLLKRGLTTNSVKRNFRHHQVCYQSSHTGTWLRAVVMPSQRFTYLT